MIINKKTEQKKAFTLIEILIVIGIIAILAGIILVMVMLKRQRAKEAEFKSVAKSTQQRLVLECTKGASGNIYPVIQNLQFNPAKITFNSEMQCDTNGDFRVTLIPDLNVVSSSCEYAVLDVNKADFSHCP